MNTTIRFRIRKEVDTPTARKILKLKGSLIAESYTDIIHFDDDGEEFYIHYFQLVSNKPDDAYNFIRDFSEENNITDIITIL